MVGGGVEGGLVWQRGACVAGGTCVVGGCVVGGGGVRGRYYEIRSFGGRYAFYWNAFLFTKFLLAS